MSDSQRNKARENLQSKDVVGGPPVSPSGSPAASTCFLCLGEGRTEREIEYLPYEITVEYETCQMCGGSGLIYPRDLYECQGRGCGILVTGETLLAMRDCNTPCRCKAPARRFSAPDKGASTYPVTADELAEAVWSLADLQQEGTK